MNLLNQILILLFSLTGILFGLMLALISPEELKKGKKYFLWTKKIIYILIFFVVNYYLYLAKNYYVLVPFTILAIVLFVVKLSIKKNIYEIFNYVVFIIPYFVIVEKNFHLLLAALIFLYGLPTGTLFKKIVKNV